MRDPEVLPKNSVLSRVHMFENKAMETRQDNEWGSRPGYRQSPSPSRGHLEIEMQQEFTSPKRQDTPPTREPPSNNYRRLTPSPGRKFAGSQRPPSPFAVHVSQRQDVETRDFLSSEREPVEEPPIQPHRKVVASPSAFSTKHQSPIRRDASPSFYRSVQSPGEDSNHERPRTQGLRPASPQIQAKMTPQQHRPRPAPATNRGDELPFARLSATRMSLEPEAVQKSPPNRRATSASPLRAGRFPLASQERGSRGRETGDRLAIGSETNKRSRATSVTRDPSEGQTRPSFSPYNAFQKAIEDAPLPSPEVTHQQNEIRASKARDQSPSGRQHTAGYSDFFTSQFAKALEGSPGMQTKSEQRKAVPCGNQSDLSNPFSIEIRTGPTTKIPSKTNKNARVEALSGNVIELTWPKHLNANPKAKTGSTTVSTSQPSTGTSQGNPFINMKLAMSRSSTEGGSKELQQKLRKSSPSYDSTSSSSSSSKSTSTLSQEDLDRVAHRALALSKSVPYMKADLSEQSSQRFNGEQSRLAKEKHRTKKSADGGPTKIYASALRLSNQLAPPTIEDVGSVDSSVTSDSAPIGNPDFGYGKRIEENYEEESSFDVIAAIGSIDSGTSSMDQGFKQDRFIDSQKNRQKASRPRQAVYDHEDEESEPSHIRRSKHLSSAVLEKTNQFLAQSLAKNQRTEYEPRVPTSRMAPQRNFAIERNNISHEKLAVGRARSERQESGIRPRTSNRFEDRELSKPQSRPKTQSFRSKVTEKAHPVRTCDTTKLKPLRTGQNGERKLELNQRRDHQTEPAISNEGSVADPERNRNKGSRFGSTLDTDETPVRGYGFEDTSPAKVKTREPAKDSKPITDRRHGCDQTPVEEIHKISKFEHRGESRIGYSAPTVQEQPDRRIDGSAKSSSTHELTALLVSNSKARDQAKPVGKNPAKQMESTSHAQAYTRLHEVYDHQDDSSDSSAKKDPFLWLHKKYGDKSPAANQDAIQKAMARSSDDRIPSPVRGVSPKKIPPTRQISEDDDDVFDGIDDESLLKDEYDIPFENRMPTHQTSSEPVQRSPSPPKRKEKIRVVHERQHFVAPKTEPKRRSPSKRQETKHSGKTIGSGFVKTVVSDITTSLITMDKNRMARHYRATNNKDTINEEPNNSTEGETMEDGACKEPPSVLLNISHAIVNSIQNACKAPEKSEGGGCSGTSVNAKCGEKLNETWAILNSHTNEEQENDGADTLLGKSQDGIEEENDSATPKTNETMTTNMLNDMERRIWEAWDKRNKKEKDDNQEEKEMEENLRQSSSSSAEQDENHEEAINTAKNSLLAHAGRALEMFGHTVAQPQSSVSDSSFTRPRPDNVGSPHSRVSSILSFNEQSNLERFSSALKNEGIEVLKLGRRNKWQVRHLTVSREVTKLGTGGVAGDIGQCPKALLWPKQFKDQAFSISQIKEDGRGGVLFEKLKKVRPTISNEFYDHHLPKKLKANFPEFAGVVLDYEHEQGVRQLHLCFKTKEDAHAFITAMLIIKEATERSVPFLGGDIET